MCTIGIHPNLKARYQWQYGILVREAAQAGLKVVSGQFDHLVTPGQSVKPAPKKITFSPSPFNGGGRAA